MTVKDLKKLIKDLPDDMPVILQKDPEGNGYSPLNGYWKGGYKAITTWYGEAGLLELNKGYIEQGYTEEDLIDGVPAIFLYPVN